MNSRQEQIDSVLEETHKIEDSIFADFSRTVGVSNIREYEEKQLKEAQEYNQRKLKFTDHISKLQNQ